MAALDEYQKLVHHLAQTHGAEPGQMFGKKCIKVKGKAGLALFMGCIVFKLPSPEHALAMGLAGSSLWDPSGKGRPMKEWVQVSTAHSDHFTELAKAAADYAAQQ